MFEEIIPEKFPNLRKETVNQVQESWSSTQDKPTEEYSTIHCNQNDKEKILKTYRGMPINQLSAGFSTEHLLTRLGWHDAFEIIR